MPDNGSEQNDNKGWFKRFKDGIQTATKFKKDTPDGLWHKCKGCGETVTIKELKENLYLCPKCDHHTRIGSHDYFDIIFDGKYTSYFDEIISKDFLEFVDLKPYEQRLEKAHANTELNDAITVAKGKVNKKN